jgi:hypothetical protein
VVVLVELVLRLVNDNGKPKGIGIPEFEDFVHRWEF